MAVEVMVIPTGCANLASVTLALRRAGAKPRIASSPEEVRHAAGAVLPGVGSLGAAMDRLSRYGMDAPAVERVREGKPTLAVCLGFQLLGTGSSESPGVKGLGALPFGASRFAPGVRVPLMGWNRVEPAPECRFLQRGWGWFAHSYRFTRAPGGWSPAWSDHGGAYVSAMERGKVLACQFHPELSGEWGAGLIRRWVAAVEEGT